MFLGRIFRYFKKCKHEFRLEDMVLTNIKAPTEPAKNDYLGWLKYLGEIYTHESVTKRVMCPCAKCMEVFYGHCGLDILSKGTFRPNSGT